ncbi:MAG: hypothetical protein IKO57_02860 [Treponema sp.]|nr:hypothetical protein [Treponema sp.]
MKITNIYDKQLQAIEEAEMKVRVAERRLFEAERELDETLDLVEAELNEQRSNRNYKRLSVCLIRIFFRQDGAAGET